MATQAANNEKSKSGQAATPRSRSVGATAASHGRCRIGGLHDNLINIVYLFKATICKIVHNCMSMLCRR